MRFSDQIFLITCLIRNPSFPVPCSAIAPIPFSFDPSRFCPFLPRPVSVTVLIPQATCTRPVSFLTPWRHVRCVGIMGETVLCDMWGDIQVDATAVFGILDRAVFRDMSCKFWHSVISVSSLGQVGKFSPRNVVIALWLYSYWGVAIKLLGLHTNINDRRTHLPYFRFLRRDFRLIPRYSHSKAIGKV